MNNNDTGTDCSGGEDNWTESDAHHTLVLGPGDHIDARNTVSSVGQTVGILSIIFTTANNEHGLHIP